MTNTKLASWLKPRPQSFHEWLAGRKIEEVECIVSDIAGIRSEERRVVKV